MAARARGEEAVQYAERLVQLDPLREDGQRLLLRQYAVHRGVAAALAHAKTLTSLLNDELGVDLDAATAELVAEIKAGTIAKPSKEAISAGIDSTGAALAAIESSKPPAEKITEVAESQNKIERSPPHQRSAQGALRTATLVLASIVVFAGAWFVAQKVNSRVPMDPGPAQSQSGTWRSPPLPADIIGIDRAALAAQAITPIIVLPFTTHAPAGSRDEIIADAITADLTTNLSRFPLFRIISGGTASAYRGRAVDASALGRELGVRYIVEGDVRTEGNTTRVNVKLVDAGTRLQVWADRFERDEASRFEIQDEITSRLARELQVGTIRAIGTGSSESTSREPEINELIAKGTAAQLRGPAAENIREALGYFEQALERDPDSAPALIGVATQMVMGSIHYLLDPKPSLDRATRALTRAEAFSPDWAYLHYIRGTMLKALNQPEDSLREQFRALELNPSFAPAYAQIASVLMAGPHPADAPPYLQYALRLSPKDPVMGIWTLIGGTMEIELGHDDEALRWLLRSRELIPNSPNVYRVLAAAYALKGDTEHAAENVARFNALANPTAARRMVEAVRRRMDHNLNKGNKASRIIDGLKRAFITP